MIEFPVKLILVISKSELEREKFDEIFHTLVEMIKRTDLVSGKSSPMTEPFPPPLLITKGVIMPVRLVRAFL